MPAAFIFAIIFAVLAVSCAVTAAVGVRVKAGEPVIIGWLAATCSALILAVVLVLASSWTQVSTQNIGIETSFGGPAGHLSNGLHFIPPWDQVTELDDAIQTDTYNGRSCVDIRIAEQQTACANVRIRWQILPQAADVLFRQYHSFGNTRTSLVTSELEVALNQQFERFNPIASLTDTAPEGSAANPTVAQLAGKVAAQMRGDIGTQIRVLNVLIPIINYPGSVQDRINTVLAQTAQTDVARQAVQTALAQAQANRDVAATVSGNPGVLQSQCLNLVSDAIKTGYAFPAGFSCFTSSQVGVLAGK